MTSGIYERTKEYKEKRKKVAIENNFVKRLGEGMLGKHHTKETKEKICLSNKGRKISKETRKKLSLALKGRKVWNKGKKGLQVAWNKGIPMSKKVKEKMIRSLQKSIHKKPNKQEKKLIELFYQYNLPYKFVGDFTIWIGGKNPDFINTNGDKKLIEYAGRYWHTEEEMDKRIKLFAEYGFETLIIWDNEFLKNPEKTMEVVTQW